MQSYLHSAALLLGDNRGVTLTFTVLLPGDVRGLVYHSAERLFTPQRAVVLRRGRFLGTCKALNLYWVLLLHSAASLGIPR